MGEKPQKKVTMRDVALLAMVSPATVSYVLGGRGEELSIEPGTQQRVLSAVKKLGYRIPQTMGRGGRQIGVLFPNVTTEYMGSQIDGIQEVLREHQYHALVCISGNDPDAERSDMAMFLRRRVEGIIAFPLCDPDAAQRWGKYVRNAPPVVFTGRGPPGREEMDCITVDNYTIGVEAAEILVREGCSSFIMVSDNVEPRLLGFKAHLKSLGLPAPLDIPWRDYKQVMAAIAKPSPHTGLFAVSEGTLFPTVYLAMRKKIAIDPTLVCATVGSIAHAYPLANRCWVAEHPTREMGRLAARRLLDRINKPHQSLFPVSLPMRWETNILLEQHLQQSTVGKRLWA